MGIASGAASGPGRACQPCVAVYLFVCVCVCVCVLRSKVQECIRASCAGAMTGDGGMEPQMERSCPSRVKSQWRGEHGGSCSVLAGDWPGWRAFDLVLGATSRRPQELGVKETNEAGRRIVGSSGNSSVGELSHQRDAEGVFVDPILRL